MWNEMNNMAILLEELRQGPPTGCPYSVALSNSRAPGRSAVYRHWMFQDALLKTLDASVTTMHDLFQQSGEIEDHITLDLTDPVFQ